VSFTLPSFPKTSDIVYSIQSALTQPPVSLITNFNIGGFTRTLIDAVAVSLGSDASSIPGVTQPGAYQILTQIQQSAFALTASGVYLDLKAADVGVTRKQATSAGAPVLFASSPPPGSNTLIPAGTLCAAEPVNPTGTPFVFVTQADITYLAGQPTSPSVLVICNTAGSGGNVQVGAINIVLSGPSGLSVTNPAAASGGTDTEQDDSPNGGLRYRTLQAIPNASQCTQSALELDALSYDGVVSVSLLDNTAADGVTFERGVVQIYIDDGTGNISVNNPHLITTMQGDFDSGKYRAAGVQVDINGSTLITVTASLHYNVSLAYTQTRGTAASVTSAIQLAVYDYIQNVPIGRAVTLAAIVAAAEAVPGCANVILSSVLINGSPSDFIPPLPQDVPRCTAAASSAITVVNNGALPDYG
jgi:uncharacterized phage protein gp47/JayE